MSIQDDIVQSIVSDLMDCGKIGEAWSASDINSRFLIMENWRRIVKDKIIEFIEDITSD